jgi:hypothetical protein
LGYEVSIQRLLNLAALFLFIVFAATFFTVLVRLSHVGTMSERYAIIAIDQSKVDEPVTTWVDLLAQDRESGRLKFHIRTRIDTRVAPFDGLNDGDVVVLRVENLIPELRRTIDLQGVFHNYTGNQYATLDFGDLLLEVLDKRDFYPFDGYEVSFNLAYYTQPNSMRVQGGWHFQEAIIIKSMTNLILLNPRVDKVLPDTEAFRLRIGRLRMQQFLAATLLLIELLFLIYLLTIVDMQEILAKCLGYIVVLYVIRNILVADAPQFPTIIDYGTLFLVCVTFFLMLFKFLGGSEERALITLPPAFRSTLSMTRESITFYDEEEIEELETEDTRDAGHKDSDEG